MAADIEREANKPGRPMADVLRTYAANLRTAAGNTQRACPVTEVVPASTVSDLRDSTPIA